MSIFENLGTQGQQTGGNLVQRLQQFARTLQGNPQQQVQQLLNSGKVSQQQYQQAYQMARQLQQMIGLK